MRTLSLQEARRLAIMGTSLGGPRPASLIEVVERLGKVQVDPTAVVERAERLTLWSRFGAYDRDKLRRMLEEPPRRLFEYRAHLVPVDDLPLHRPAMRRFPRPEYGRGRYIGEWLRDNAAFRAYILEELRTRGPLLSRDLDDRAEVPWRTGGWNDGKNLGRMLEILWQAGEIAISRRQGSQRVWDLLERVLPSDDAQLPDEVVAIDLVERQLRSRGFEPPGWATALDYRLPARDLAEESVRADGVAVPLAIDSLPGEWLAHADLLRGLDAGDWQPRTTLLGPFDPLVSDRERAEWLFAFRFRLEIYVPAAKRQYGYYVLPILHGDRLVGRIDPAMDRKAGVLKVNSVYAEPDAPADAWPAIETAIDELAEWLGATAVLLPTLPAPWGRGG
ncbi:MAG TPA: crosslink repair DNA glycosylase YcaQ family protein [Candidatus Limnocylindrales bacterium]|nr:crosslink repair DNA glycosylase YcaQ family protein [Candidatus Limnocylindrales bacterium]